MSTPKEKELWYDSSLVGFLVKFILLLIVLTMSSNFLKNYSDTNPDEFKLIITASNFIVAVIFCIAIWKPNTLYFETEEGKLVYWDLLNVERNKANEVEVDGENVNCIKIAENNEKRVNKLVEHFSSHIWWFSALLVIVYASFMLDNPKLFSKQLLDKLHPFLKIAQDLSNFLNSLFMFLGFMVLYDITLDKNNKKRRYSLLPTIFVCVLAVIYIVVAFLPIFFNQNFSENEMIKGVEGVITQRNESLSKPENKDINNINEREFIEHVENLVKKTKDDNSRTKLTNSDFIKYVQTLENLDKYNKTQVAKDSKVKIDEFLSYKLVMNIMQLIIGILNGLAFALIFGRYISMEHSLQNIEKGNYTQFTRWGIIIILPIYALAQPLFGSFEIDAFGSPVTFQNFVFFICFIGKVFLFYVTWSFMRKNLMHYYLHSVLAKHGIPSNFDTCFKKTKESKKESEAFVFESDNTKKEAETSDKDFISSEETNILNEQKDNKMRKKILFVAANPTNQSDLQTDREHKIIKAEMRSGKHRDYFEFLEPQFAVTITDLIRSLKKQKPHIIHFSGHGTEEGIVITNDTNTSQILDIEILERLFKNLIGITEIIILNSCYSASQAEAISKFGMYVIGNTEPIDDDGAISFAKGLYVGLSEGENFEEAMNDALIVVMTESRKDSKIIEVWKDGERVTI